MLALDRILTIYLLSSSIVYRVQMCIGKENTFSHNPECGTKFYLPPPYELELRGGQLETTSLLKMVAMV